MRSFYGQIFVTLLLGSCVTTSSQNEVKKSSDVPERREFPVSLTEPPCKDFYRYACGPVVDQFVLPEDRSIHDFAFHDSAERLLRKKEKFLAELPQQSKLSKRSQRLRDVYAACMNEKAAAREESDLLEQTKKDLLLIKDRDALLSVTGANIVKPKFSFLSFGTLPNHDSPDWQDLMVLGNMSSLPEHSYYENAALMKDYQEVVTEFFKITGEKNPSKIAKQIIDLETEYMKTFPKPAELREVFSQRSSVKRAAFLSKYKNLRMQALFTKAPKFSTLRDLTPKSYQWMDQALAKTDLDTLKSYYLFREVFDEIDDSNLGFFQKKFEFRKKYLGGSNQRAPRQERCTKMVMNKFDKEIDAELIDVVFPDFSKTNVVNLAEKVRRAILRGLEQNKWLTAEGKANAARKIRTANLMLVKPSNERDWDFNPDVAYHDDQPITNERKLSAALIEKEIAEMKIPRNRSRWYMGPLTINAYYNPPDNQFVLPAGILQYPMYDAKLPDAENIGAIGAIIGHELGHAIDDVGSRFDEKGRLKPILGAKDLEQFKNRTKGFVDQFDKLGLNGQLSLGENIGDHVGLRFAYDAAFPKGDPTPEQQRAFFLQYARVWCYVGRPKFMEMLAKTDPHPPGQARVNAQVVHHDGFAQAFQCKAGDAMFLPVEQRVRVW